MLNRETTGLILVDIQGKLAQLVHNSSELIASCELMIKGAEVLGLPIVWLEQNPEKLGATVDSLRSLLQQQDPVSKYTFSACSEPAFMQAVEESGRDSWLVCGIETHICVYQTALGLKNRNYAVEVISDCVSSRNPAHKQLAITRLASHGIAATCVEMCLYEMLGDCRSDEFRKILKLVK